MQNVAGGCLLLQSFRHLRVGLGERLIPLLKLSEQPDVLDRDHGLVGEGLKEADVRV